jgi:hypothetical protein
MQPMIRRRGFITGLVALVAAPAIVRAGSLMPVKVMIEPGIRYHSFSVEEMTEALLAHLGRQINPPVFMDQDTMMRTYYDGRYIRSEPVMFR